MTNGPAIVIKGDFHFWPGGPRTLTELPVWCNKAAEVGESAKQGRCERLLPQ